MGSNTPNLNLYKVNPTEDGESTFNIDTMLNDNWDKIDGFKQEYNKLEDEVLNPTMASTGKQVSSIINLPNAVDGQAGVEVEGRTYSNLMCIDGKGDSVSNWAGSKKLSENGEFKLIGKGTGDSAFGYIKDVFLYHRYYFCAINGKSTNDNSSKFRFGITRDDLSQEWFDTSYFKSKYGTYGVKFSFNDTGSSVSNSFLFPLQSTNDSTVTYFKNVQIVQITEDEYNSLTVDELAQKYTYVSGVKSSGNTIVRSVGKNLVKNGNGEEGVSYWNAGGSNKVSYDNSTGYFSKKEDSSFSGYHKIFEVKNNTTYTLSAKGYVSSAGGVGAVYAIYVNKNNETIGSYCSCVFSSDTSPARKYKTFTTPNDDVERFIKVYPIANSVTLYFKEVQIEEGSSSTTYEPYKESLSYITLPDGVEVLRSLPNDVKDEVTTDGKLIQRTKEYILQESDILEINTQYAIPYAKINKPTDYIFSSSNVREGLTAVILEGYPNVYSTDLPNQYDDNGNIGKLSISFSNTMFLVGFSSGSTLEQARELLAGTKVIYQLAESHVYDIPVTPITCFKDGTVYIESADDDEEYVVPETQFTYPVNTAGVIQSNTVAINQLSNLYQLTKGQQFDISDEQKLQILGQQITQLKLGGM